MKHIVGFSGGIDSQAAARWVLNRYPADDVILLNSDAGGNEHALTTEFIRRYSETVHPVVMISPIVADAWGERTSAETLWTDGDAPLDFGMLLKATRIPVSHMRRFCTLILKIKPQRRWITSHFGPTGEYCGMEYERYTGMRRDESPSRANIPDREWDAFNDCYVNHPLAAWTKDACFDFVRSHGEPINPLYSLGFPRVGCAPCALCGKEEIANWADRFPAVIDKIERWENESGVTFFRRKFGDEARGIREIVRWAKTSHGGLQQLLPYNPPACESRYGLCE